LTFKQPKKPDINYFCLRFADESPIGDMPSGNKLWDIFFVDEMVKGEKLS